MTMKAQMTELQKTLELLVVNQVTKEYFDDKISSLEQRVDKLNEKLEKVDKKVIKLENKVDQELPDTIYKEMHNQEKCKKNVLAFGVQEQEGNSDKERYVKDKEKVGRLLDAINDINLVSEGDISYTIRRLGHYKVESAKPRPLQISFKTSIVRGVVLSCCKKLKGKEEWQGVSVVPDLTKTQQRLSKTMRAELLKEAEKKNNDRKDSVIDKFEFAVRGHYGIGNLRIAKIYYQDKVDE